MVVVSAIASLAAIAGELMLVRNLEGIAKGLHIALAGFTLMSSWAFIQVMFALHYAHEYYATAGEGHRAGRDFPGEERPDYGDFFYFAAIIGTSGQTADVALASRSMRRIGTVHCVLAYLFNTTVLALLINIGASLFRLSRPAFGGSKDRVRAPPGEQGQAQLDVFFEDRLAIV